MKARAIIAILGVAGALGPSLSHRPWGTPAPPDPRVVRGALHVHGPYSEDAGTGVDRIAREARQAGLDFVILTDHGRDDTASGYRDGGVLILTGMEKSTDAGHALVLGASPLGWRLDGEPSTVVEDARRQGGFVIAAHPSSTRADSRWTAGCEGLAGLEALNFADPGAWPHGAALLPILLRYPLDPRGALLRAFRPGRDAILLWDACLAERDVAGWLGSDAHGGLPSHRAIFRLGSNHLMLAQARNGDAVHDGALVWRALRQGRGYAALDGLADASRFRFEAASGDRRAGPGETLAVEDGATARVEADVVGPPGTELVLVRDGQPLARGPRIAQDVDAGVYRIEGYLAPHFVPGGRRTPWILSNAIAVFPTADAHARGERNAPAPRADPAPTASADVERFDDGHLAPTWQIDRAADAQASVRPEAGTLRWDFRLGPGARTYASVTDYRERDFSAASGLAFRVRGSTRFRFDVQVRVRDGERIRFWRRSVLAGPEWGDASLPFAALRTYDGRGGAPDLSRVVAVYFVVETAHLPAGAAGTLWIDDLGLLP